MLFCDRPHIRRDQSFHKSILWHIQAPLLHITLPLPLIISSQGSLPYNRLWALSLRSPRQVLHYLPVSLWPILPALYSCFFRIPGSHLSTFLSWPLALAPAPVASRAQRAPRTSRAAGTPGRIAASSRTGVGTLAMAQEARSAVWEPGLFCSTTQKCSWARGGKQTVNFLSIGHPVHSPNSG